MNTVRYTRLIKVFCLNLAFICLSFSLQAQEGNEPPKKWTLQACIQHALDHNIDIQQAYLDLKDAKIDKSDALGNYLPDVSANLSNTWNSGLTQDVTTGILEQQTVRSFSLGATASVPLFHGLRNLREAQRAKLSKLSSQYSLEEMKDDVILNIANAYLTVLNNKENLEVLLKQNEVTQEQLRNTRAKIEAGAAPSGDSLDIKATDADEKQEIVKAKNDIRISLINLAQLLQIDDYKNFDIADTSYDVPLETILSKTPQKVIERAKETRYEIKTAEKDLELAQKDVEIARSDYYPSLDGFINFNTRESGAHRMGEQEVDPDEPTQVIGQVKSTGEDVVSPNYISTAVGADPFFEQLSRNKGWQYGFRLSIPVLNGFSTRNSVRRRKIDVQRNKNELKQAKLDLESNVYQAYVDAQGAAEAYVAAQKSVAAKEKAYEYSKERFDIGDISSFEFSQAKFDLADVQSQLVNAKFDYIFKLKVLELYFGVKPEDLKL